MTAYARFDEHIPKRFQEYVEKFNNYHTIELLKMTENVDDYMYLVGLKHCDGHMLYIPARVVER